MKYVYTLENPIQVPPGWARMVPVHMSSAELMMAQCRHDAGVNRENGTCKSCGATVAPLWDAATGTVRYYRIEATVPEPDEPVIVHSGGSS